MMQKKKSNPWARAKYAIAVPVAALSVALFATPTASALSAEISGCKVSDLFSADQDSNPKNYVTIVYQAGVEGYSAHLIDEKGTIQSKTLTDEDLKEIYSKDGQLTLKLAKETPMQYLSELKKRCKDLNIIRLSYGDNESVHLIFERADLSRPSSSAIVIDELKASSTKPSLKFEGLRLLDGQPISAEEFNKLSADIIESMEILKDDENISKYIGQYPEAKNGIIKITTKK